MVTIKRNLLLFLVVVAFIAGVSGTAIYMDISLSNFLDRPGEGGSFYLSEEDYTHYEYLKETYEKADLLRAYILENYYIELDEEDLNLGILRGLFEGLDDPYSYYMTAQEYESILISLTGEYSGIGVTLSPNEEGFIEVIAPTEGTPAEEIGIKSGDVITKVDGVAYSGAEIDVAAAAIRGRSGTKVTITILRAGEENDFTIERKTILSKTVKSDILDDNIGYIRISSFEESTYPDFKEQLSSMEEKNVAGLVIDLRDNPGGLVDSCIDIADLLMDKGTVVYSENQAGERDYYNVKDGSTSIPYVLLVNGGTASSAEILCAGIQDNAEGKVVGTLTYGKGIIQQMEQLSDGSAVNLTILQYFSPNGRVIHRIGITPDYVVELNEEDYNQDGTLIHDKQLDQALALLKN
ncbi:MAG: S41 family peptidase [Clostridia bacterium]|nr:S41 family peptidase [Clostridia bacterium]